jgi:hypothetical protein
MLAKVSKQSDIRPVSTSIFLAYWLSRHADRRVNAELLSAKCNMSYYVVAKKNLERALVFHKCYLAFAEVQYPQT